MSRNRGPSCSYTGKRSAEVNDLSEPKRLRFEPDIFAELGSSLEPWGGAQLRGTGADVRSGGLAVWTSDEIMGKSPQRVFVVGILHQGRQYSLIFVYNRKVCYFKQLLHGQALARHLSAPSAPLSRRERSCHPKDMVVFGLTEIRYENATPCDFRAHRGDAIPLGASSIGYCFVIVTLHCLRESSKYERNS